MINPRSQRHHKDWIILLQGKEKKIGSHKKRPGVWGAQEYYVFSGRCVSPPPETPSDTKKAKACGIADGGPGPIEGRVCVCVCVDKGGWDEQPAQRYPGISVLNGMMVVSCRHRHRVVQMSGLGFPASESTRRCPSNKLSTNVQALLYIGTLTLQPSYSLAYTRSRGGRALRFLADKSLLLLPIDWKKTGTSTGV